MAVLDSVAGEEARAGEHRSTPGAAGVAVACSGLREMTRRRVRAALAHDQFTVAIFAPDVDAMLEAVIARRVDVLVVGCTGAFLDDPAPLRTLRVQLPEAGLVVVSSAEGAPAVRKALAAGADGYVREARIEDALAPALLAVAASQVCIPSDVREVFGKPAFSFREKQVLQLVARGFTNGEIAQALYLAESTIKSHLSSSFRKLGVGSRKEAAAIVLDPENGLNLEILGDVQLPAELATRPGD